MSNLQSLNLNLQTRQSHTILFLACNLLASSEFLTFKPARNLESPLEDMRTTLDLLLQTVSL
jgi:hypothetical protein